MYIFYLLLIPSGYTLISVIVWVLCICRWFQILKTHFKTVYATVPFLKNKQTHTHKKTFLFILRCLSLTEHQISFTVFAQLGPILTTSFSVQKDIGTK